MAWSTQLDNLTNQTVTVAPLSGVDDYGDPSFGAASTYAARVVWEPHRTVDFTGVERVAMARVIIATTETIEATAQVTLPNGESPSIVSMREVPWTDGATHHWMLSLGGSNA